MSSDKISFPWKKVYSQVVSYFPSNGQTEVIIFRWSQMTLFFITFSGRQEIKYCLINYYCIINLLLNSRKIPRWKSSFSICNLAFSSASVNWPKAFCTFLSAFSLLLTRVLCPVCSEYLPMDFGCLAKFRSAWECKRGQCGQDPTWNSSCQVLLPHQSPDPEQQCSPVALLGSSAAASWSQAANRKSQLHQLPATLLLLYNTGDHMKGPFPLFKGLFAANTALPVACSHWAGNLSWQRHS